MDEYVTVTESGCHEWTGSRFLSGYGRVKINGVTHRAHRLVWACAHGPIPEGMFVLHRCDNPPCVRLDHLFLGTHADNMADMAAKGRASRNLTRRYPRGDEHRGAKLSDAQVEDVRRRYAAGEASQTALAAEFGVSQPLISQVVRRVAR
jgi:hypothetical protein